MNQQLKAQDQAVESTKAQYAAPQLVRLADAVETAAAPTVGGSDGTLAAS